MKTIFNDFSRLLITVIIYVLPLVEINKYNFYVENSAEEKNRIK